MMSSMLGGVALFATILWTGPLLADPAETVKAVGEDASWMLILTAPEAEFDGLTLTLKNINPSMVMFTDRPVRMAERISTINFVSGWGKGGMESFAGDPPNAALTSVVGEKLRIATVELSEPRLDGTTLTFEALVIEGTLPPTARTVSLFIDRICFSCSG